MLATGQISGGINNTENYSVMFWDLIQQNQEVLSATLAQQISE